MSTRGAARMKTATAGLTLGRRLAAALAGLGAFAPLLHATAVPQGPRFAVYYGHEDAPALSDCDVAVLDAEADDRLLARRAQGAIFLGYLSMGEIHATRTYAAAAESAGILLHPNPHWPDARFVDMRAEAWSRLVLEQLVPAIVARGFDGVFLDTLDDAEHLETTDPARFAGMVAAAAALVRRMRQRFPTLRIMINRGYAVLPQIGGRFDMLLGESVRAAHDAARGGYILLPDRDYAWQRERMWEARRRDPALRLFALDYWDPEDTAGIARLYREHRRNGFIPYVATRDLTRIVPWPAGGTP